jgi:hypothetical protein
MNAFFIEGIEKYAPDRLRIANIVQYFINKQLSFPVRVTGIDQGIGLFYELADDLELFFARRADQKFPLPGDDWQVFRTPRFVTAVIILLVLPAAGRGRTPRSRYHRPYGYIHCHAAAVPAGIWPVPGPYLVFQL